MRVSSRNAVAAALAICVLIAGVLSIVPIRAASPYHVTLTTSNFNLHLLSASAEDLSDTSHAMFSLQNGTPLWYGISIQSNPSGMTPVPASGSADIVTSTFSGSILLLPPAGVLPFDQSNNAFHFETLKLAVAFSGPNQQIQFDLSPFETHAVTLDMLTLLLQLLGEKNTGAQIGLLAPSGLQEIFDSTSTMKDFQSLTNDYIQILQALPVKTAMLTNAYKWAKDLVALLTDADEQQVLVDLLWKILGKTVPYSTVLKTVTSFAGAQFGLGMEGFISDEALVIGSVLIQQNDPTVTLQTVVSTPRPRPTPTQQRPTPTPTSIPDPPATTIPAPSPTRSPTPEPSPSPTRKATATPVK